MTTQITKTLKVVVTILCLWTFLNTYLLLTHIENEPITIFKVTNTGPNSIRLDNPIEKYPKEMFYPFTNYERYGYSTSYFDIRDCFEI